MDSSYMIVYTVCYDLILDEEVVLKNADILSTKIIARLWVNGDCVHERARMLPVPDTLNLHPALKEFVKLREDLTRF
jgi:hypothetical protein